MPRSSARSSGQAVCAETYDEAAPAPALARAQRLPDPAAPLLGRERGRVGVRAHALARHRLRPDSTSRARAQTSRDRGVDREPRPPGRPRGTPRLPLELGSVLQLVRAVGGQRTGDLETRARLALRAAGDRAHAVNAFPQPSAYYGEAPPDGRRERRPAAARLSIRRRAVIADDGSGGRLETARESVLEAGDHETASKAELSLSRIWWNRGHNDQAREHEERAKELMGGSLLRRVRGSSPTSRARAP